MTVHEKQLATATVLFETQQQGVKIWAEPATYEEILEWVKKDWFNIAAAVAARD